MRKVFIYSLLSSSGDKIDSRFENTKKQFDLSQTNMAGAVADRQLGQGGQIACEDTWNTTVDDQTPVRFYLFLLVNNVCFWFDDATYNPFFRNQVKRGATNSSKVSLLNLQDQQEVTANQIKPKASQSDTNMTKMQNLEEAHLALNASRSRIEHQENILAALENRVSSLFNDSGEFSKIKIFKNHGGLPCRLSKRVFKLMLINSSRDWPSVE